MTLKKSFVSMCVLCCALFGMSQSVSAQSILYIYNQATGNNGGRFAGDHWGRFGGEQYISAEVDFLIESFGQVATIDLYDISVDPQLIAGAALATSTTQKLAFLNSYDLIVISNSPTSGQFNNGSANPIWNQQVTSAIWCMKSFLTNAGRWGWHSGTTTPAESSTLVASTLSTATEVLAIEGGGQVRLFDAGPYSDLGLNTVWYNGNNLTPTTQTQLSQRMYRESMANTSATLVARWPGYANSLAIAKWDAGSPYYTGSAYTAGGPRLLSLINDDRNEIPQADLEVTTPSSTTHKSYNCFEVLSDEGKSFLRNLIVDMVPALAPERKILVIGNSSDGLYTGRYWGPDGNDTYESDLVKLMEEFFAPTAWVNYYDIGQSDYMGLVGMNSTTNTQVAFLNGHDFVILSNAPGTGQMANNAVRSRTWNQEVTAPLIQMAQFAIGTNSNRWGWVNINGNPPEYTATTPTEVLVVNDSGHPAFDNVDVSGGTLRLFNEAPYTPNNNWFSAGATNSGLPNFGQRAHVNALADTNGNRIAEFQGYTNYVNIVVWDAGTPFYTGGAYTPAAPRALLNINDNRNHIDPATIDGAVKAYSCLAELTPEGKQMIKDLMVSMSSVPLPVELGSFELE